MKNLLPDLHAWRERLRQEPLAVFLDYDGTLSAIAPTPSEAALPHATRDILKALVRLKDVKVAVISGRALADIRKMVPVKGLSYVGSHGMEFQSGRVVTRRIPERYWRELCLLKQALAVELKGLPGAWLEQKPFSLAIHYRKAAPVSERKVKQVVRGLCGRRVRRGEVLILSGKKVIEIMPPKAMDKGQAVKRLLRAWGKRKFLSIYIGDDRTDEAAFDVLCGCGLTVKVGASRCRTKAAYRVNGVDEVRLLLEMILRFKSARVNPGTH